MGDNRRRVWPKHAVGNGQRKEVKTPNTAKRRKGGAVPFTAPQCLKIFEHLSRSERWRDCALFSVGIDTLLRSSDLLSLTLGDIQYSDGSFREAFTVTQKKTKEPVEVTLTPESIWALHRWLAERTGLDQHSLLFPGRRPGSPLSLRRYQFLVKEWASSIGLPPDDYSSHSLRKTKSTLVHEKNRDVEESRILLGHRRLSSTSTYLGAAKRRALKTARGIRLFEKASLFGRGSSTPDARDEIDRLLEEFMTRIAEVDREFRDDDRLRAVYDFICEIRGSGGRELSDKWRS